MQSAQRSFNLQKTAMDHQRERHDGNLVGQQQFLKNLFDIGQCGLLSVGHIFEYIGR